MKNKVQVQRFVKEGEKKVDISYLVMLPTFVLVFFLAMVLGVFLRDALDNVIFVFPVFGIQVALIIWTYIYFRKNPWLVSQKLGRIINILVGLAVLGFFAFVGISSVLRPSQSLPEPLALCSESDCSPLYGSNDRWIYYRKAKYPKSWIEQNHELWFDSISFKTIGQDTHSSTFAMRSKDGNYFLVEALGGCNEHMDRVRASAYNVTAYDPAGKVLESVEYRPFSSRESELLGEQFDIPKNFWAWICKEFL